MNRSTSKSEMLRIKGVDELNENERSRDDSLADGVDVGGIPQLSVDADAHGTFCLNHSFSEIPFN